MKTFINEVQASQFNHFFHFCLIIDCFLNLNKGIAIYGS
jgi:hypothetical protein